MRFYLVCLFSFFLSGSTLFAAPVRWITPDFYVAEVEAQSPRSWIPVSSVVGQDCRQHIEDVVCFDGVDDDGNSACVDSLEGVSARAYAQPLQAIYDRYPPFMQKMFCSLQEIIILPAFVGTAFAGVLHDSNGTIVGARMGIRKSVIDEAVGFTLWSSWKEQLSFGGVKDDYKLDQSLPLFTLDFDGEDFLKSPEDFLYFVIAHEFGHIFDFSNAVNHCSVGDDPNDEHCYFDEDSFGGIAWQHDRVVKPEHDYYHRDQLCFYWCDANVIASEAIANVYTDLFKSSFISTYGSTNPWDDFAESVAYWLMDKELRARIAIQFEGQVFDVASKLQSLQFERKRSYVETFFSKPIIYPGQ